jgi:hypothetical protein
MTGWFRGVFVISCVALSSCALPDVDPTSACTPATAFVRVMRIPASDAAALVMDACSPKMCRPVESPSCAGDSRLLPSAIAKDGEVVLKGSIDDVRTMLDLLHRLESGGGGQ